MLEKWGFSLLLRLCTGRKKFFWFFSQMSSFSTTLFLQNELFNSHERFFSQRYGHIKFWHLSEQPYEHSYWRFGAYHFAFENLSWKFVFAGFDGLWIRIYSQKIDISISKMADSKWRIEIYEIKRFCSLKTLTWGFRSFWLRKWGRKIDISISKMVDSMSRIKTKINFRMQNGMHQRVNVWIWRERVVLNDDIWEKNQKNFLRPVHNLKSSEKPHFSST